MPSPPHIFKDLIAYFPCNSFGKKKKKKKRCERDKKKGWMREGGKEEAVKGSERRRWQQSRARSKFSPQFAKP